VSVIAAAPVFTRRLTVVLLRAEHADEMAAVLAGPRICTSSPAGEPPTPRELHARCRPWIAGTTRQTTRTPKTVNHQLDLGTDIWTGVATVPASRRLGTVRGRPVPTQRPIKGYVGVEAFRARIQV
jgi:hypothetical protein